MDMTTILVIVVIVLLLGGGGLYGRVVLTLISSIDIERLPARS